MRYLLPLIMLAGSAAAQTCPPAPDHSAEIAVIEEGLKRAASQGEARELNNQLWELWLDAPDPIAKEMLNDGMARREVFDFLGAYAAFSDLIDYCPEYPEGYNQRAFASFLSQNYELALEDLDKTLEMQPNHIGALSGKALTLMGMGRQEEAQEPLRQAVRLNPWLNERALLTEPIGTDL